MTRVDDQVHVQPIALDFHNPANKQPQRALSPRLGGVARITHVTTGPEGD